MESLNNSLENVKQFILCIQDACDNHRKSMEHLWQQEYASYVNKWKPNLSESKLPNMKNSGVKSNIVSKCVQIESKEKPLLESDLELTLADALLEKARDIRTKNMKLLNGLVDCRNLSTFSSDKVVTSGSVRCDLKLKSENIKYQKKFPQSKSDININSHKSCIVPRSKSADIPLVPNNPARTLYDNKKFTALSSKSNALKNTNSAKNKTSKDFAVISNKDLDKLKTLQLNLPACNKSKEGKKIQPSDASKSRNPHQTSSHPSSAEFFNLMKDQLNNISCELNLRIWYPFLSSKSETFLTTFNCNSFPTVKKVYTILYNIQEAMIWIDLLHLLETEIIPNLTVDATDLNSLRVYSYLHSIAHPNLKRTPIIFPAMQ